MKLYRFLLLLPALMAYASGFAQSASLTADSKALSPNGGDVVLTATATYTGQPGAVAWAIDLPASWSLVNVGGANVPAVTPDTGAVGTLEFAFTQVPAGGATFTVTVHYPPGASAAAATPTTYIRANGALITLRPEPVAFEKAKANSRQPIEK
jgi:hypothetical protein